MTLSRTLQGNQLLLLVGILLVTRLALAAANPPAPPSKMVSAAPGLPTRATPVPATAAPAPTSTARTPATASTFVTNTREVAVPSNQPTLEGVPSA